MISIKCVQTDCPGAMYGVSFSTEESIHIRVDDLAWRRHGNSQRKRIERLTKASGNSQHHHIQRKLQIIAAICLFVIILFMCA